MAELTNTQQGNKDFISIFDGKLVQRVPDGTEGAVQRKLTKGANEGKLVSEKTYNQVQGYITGGEIAVKEFGSKKVKEIQINLDDNIVLQLPMTYLSGFAKPLPNVDVKKEVQISVYKNKRGKTKLNISQGGNNIQWAYSQETPNGLPDVTQDDLGDWDFRDHDIFLELKVKEFFSTLEGAQEAPQGQAYDESGIVPQDEPVDDIPF
jgi:hypothetical protein|tara:strand:- start:10349 stop:10969 length:621 start_codon:yes stop_codon:yes gene_type:complete